MRIRIEHRTTYLYDEPPTSTVEILRLTPRNYEGLQVRQWHIDVNHDAYLAAGEDAFGNLTHTLSLHRPFDDLSITVHGEVETHDTHGVVRGTFERFPPGLYLRETPLTHADSELADFAGTTMEGHEILDGLHELMTALHRQISFDRDQADVSTTAVQTFAAGRGVCQDFAHLFIACARAGNVPARYVSGYMMRTDTTLQDAGHAWAEAYVTGLGWVGFDAANNVSPAESHVRVGIGLDYLGAAPIRGVRRGGAAEKLAVQVTVAGPPGPEREQAQGQRQQQS